MTHGGIMASATDSVEALPSGVPFEVAAQVVSMSRPYAARTRGAFTAAVVFAALSIAISAWTCWRVETMTAEVRTIQTILSTR